MIPLRHTALIALAVVALAGCGGEGDGKSGTNGTGGSAGVCAPPNRVVGDACREPGVQDDGCPAGTLGLEDGSCRPAGIPPEMCGEGFEPDGAMGCTPILPAEPCPKGQMAIPGETACHEVAPCGSGTWGEIPVESDTELVDAAYAGGGSDGSAAKPWPTIQEGIDAAASGAVVAVAAGSYAEDVLIVGKPVRVWGRCPALVEIEGSATALAAVYVRTGAAGTEVHSLAVRGAAAGILLSGSQDVLVDRVWIHDTAERALNVQDFVAPTGIAVEGTLIEGARALGVVVLGSDATIERTVVRGTQPAAPDQTVGRGIDIQASPKTGQRSNLTLRSSVVRQNRDVGVLIEASDATVETTVVQDTQPRASDQARGRGIEAEGSPTTRDRAHVTIRSSVVDQNREVGVFVEGSDATVEATSVTGTQPQPSDQSGGAGLAIHDDFATGERSNLTLRSSIVRQNRDLGVFVLGSDVTIEATVVQDTQPVASDDRRGLGVGIQDDIEHGQRSSGTLRASVVAENRTSGVFVSGSDATIEGTLVQRTEAQASDQGFGWGINVQDDFAASQRSSVAVRSSVVGQNRGIGVFVAGSDATIEGTLVEDTQPQASDQSLGRGINVEGDPAGGVPASADISTSMIDRSLEFGIVAFGAGGAIAPAISADVTVGGCLVRATQPNVAARFGDGISACSEFGPARLSVGSTRIEDSARAGVSSFGAFVSLASAVVQCASFDLEGEPYEGAPFTFDDLGGNACGCPSADGACLLETVGIEPPSPVTPIE